MNDDFDYDALHKGLEAEEDDQAWKDLDEPQEDPNAILEPDEAAENEEQLGYRTVPLSYKKIKQYFYEHQPMDRANAKIEQIQSKPEECKFPWKEVDIGILPCRMSSIDEEKWVTNCAKEIGLGPTLFLMSQKALFYLFILLSLVNIPLFLFYLRGNGGQGAVEVNLVTTFGFLSMGNLGDSKHICSSINVGNYEKNFDFSCKYGTMKELTEYGLQRVDNQSCTHEGGNFLGEGPAMHTWDDLQYDCNLETGLTESGKGKL